MHEDAPAALLYEPARQKLHETAPVTEYLPAGQIEQKVAPIDEYLPAGHILQPDALIEPGLEIDPAYPERHIEHELTDAEIPAVNTPTGQDVHVEEPEA